MSLVINLLEHDEPCPSFTDEQLAAMVENTKIDDNGEEAQNLILFVAQHCYWEQYDVLTKFYNMIDISSATMFAIGCCLRTSFPRRNVIEGWKPLLIRAYDHFKSVGEDVDDAFVGLTQDVDK